MIFDEEYFTNTEDKIPYYTGLPFTDILQNVFRVDLFPGARKFTDQKGY